MISGTPRRVRRLGTLATYPRAVPRPATLEACPDSANVGCSGCAWFVRISPTATRHQIRRSRAGPVRPGARAVPSPHPTTYSQWIECFVRSPTRAPLVPGLNRVAAISRSPSGSGSRRCSSSGTADGVVHVMGVRRLGGHPARSCLLSSAPPTPLDRFGRMLDTWVIATATSRSGRNPASKSLSTARGSPASCVPGQGHSPQAPGGGT